MIPDSNKRSRATIIRSIIANNTAWDGCVYARCGGVQVFDSIASNNGVDGSDGTIGSAGDIPLVRSHSDGNATDGALSTPTRTAT